MLRGRTKWLGLLVVVALAWGSSGGQAFAAPPDATQTVTVTATVNTTFTLTLDAGTVTLTGNPGTTQTQARIATVLSNFVAGNPWQLQIKKDRDLKDDGTTETIASAQFTHTSTGGAGSHADSSDTTFSTTSTTYYTATGTEKNNLPGGTAITSTAKLVIPTNQAAGTYTTTVVHTLTANF